MSGEAYIQEPHHSATEGKHERRLASLLTQQQHLLQRLGDTEVRFLENDGWLHRLENEMKLLGEEAQAPEVRRPGEVGRLGEVVPQSGGREL